MIYAHMLIYCVYNLAYLHRAKMIKYHVHIQSYWFQYSGLLVRPLGSVPAECLLIICFYMWNW